MELKVTGISPVSGSLEGGTELTITGINFSPTIKQNQVMIGNGFCDITSATSTELKCTTISAEDALAVIDLITPVNTGTTSEPILEISVLVRIVEVATCDPTITCTFSYLLSETPELTSIVGAALVSAGDTLTVSGTINSLDLKTEFLELSASVEDESLILTEDSVGSGFTFVMPVLPYGSYTMKVKHSTYGYVKNTIAMNNSLHISSISPSTGSSHGTRLTINGNGFPLDSTKIYFGDD